MDVIEDPAAHVGRVVSLWRRYRSSELSRWNRAKLRAANALTLLSAAGIAFAAGAILTAIGVGRAQIAVTSNGSSDLFSYLPFLLGVGLVGLGGACGLLAVASSASKSMAKRRSPFVIESTYGVYSHEWKETGPRRLRVCVYNSEPEDLYEVRVRLLGGNPIRATGWLRVMDDDAAPYRDSRSGVSIPGYQHRYFLVAEIDRDATDIRLGFANEQLTRENPVGIPSPNAPPDERTFVMLAAEGRRISDNSFVAMGYENVEIVNNGDNIIGLKPMPPAERLYRGPTTREERMRFP